jgi:hypothetical protein
MTEGNHQRDRIFKAMWRASLLVVVLYGPSLAETPQPVSYEQIPDPPDDAERHITVGGERRGPVQLYTGYLNGWHPDQNVEIARTCTSFTTSRFVLSSAAASDTPRVLLSTSSAAAQWQIAN